MKLSTKESTVMQELDQWETGLDNMTRQDRMISILTVLHIICVIALAVGLSFFYMDYIKDHTFDKVSKNQKYYDNHMFRTPWNEWMQFI